MPPLSKGSPSNAATTMCPASWYATLSAYFSSTSSICFCPPPKWCQPLNAGETTERSAFTKLYKCWFGMATAVACSIPIPDGAAAAGASGGAVAMLCRVIDPDRKGKVESAVGHAKRTRLKGLRFESLEAKVSERQLYSCGCRPVSAFIREHARVSPWIPEVARLSLLRNILLLRWPSSDTGTSQ